MRTLGHPMTRFSFHTDVLRYANTAAFSSSNFIVVVCKYKLIENNCQGCQFRSDVALSQNGVDFPGIVLDDVRLARIPARLDLSVRIAFLSGGVFLGHTGSAR